MTSSLGLINLLERLTELGKPVDLLDHWFIMKTYHSATARWRRCIGQEMGERAWSFHDPSEAILPASPRVLQPVCSLNSVLFGVLWRLHYIGMIDCITGHW